MIPSSPSAPSTSAPAFPASRRRHRRAAAHAGARVRAATRVVPAVVLAALPDGRFLTAGRTCRLAASCLALPAAGDTVLVARLDGASWIVAVLAASGTRPIHAAGPTIRLEADRCELRSARLRTESEHWEAVHADVDLSAGRLRAVVAAAEGLFGTLTSWARDCFAWRERSLRQVSGVDSMRCGTLDVQASELLALGGGTGVLQARGLLKIDAAQVHVG